LNFRSGADGGVQGRVEGELDVHLPGTLSDGEASDIAAGEPSLEDEL
jgi:hypothetical protein